MTQVSQVELIKAIKLIGDNIQNLTEKQLDELNMFLYSEVQSRGLLDE